MAISDVIEQSIDNAVRDGLSFPIVVVMVSRQAKVWAMEARNDSGVLELDNLCSNLYGGNGIDMPIILYLSDRTGKTFQAEILPDTGGAAQA
jgi:hypothetical protein